MKARTIQSVLRLSLNVVVLFILLGAFTPKSWAASCASLPTAAQLKTFLGQAASGTGISASLGPGTGVGGLFSGQRMWAAVVDRDGEICAFATSTSDPTQVWPGSQQIAKARLTRLTPLAWTRWPFRPLASIPSFSRGIRFSV